MKEADFQEEYSGTVDFTTTETPTKKIEEKRISWEEFQREYLTREDEFKYEWVDGKIEKTKRTINYTQFFILRNLQTFLQLLIAENKASGILIQKGDIFFGKKHRKPDVAWFSDEQIDKTAKGKNQVPEFVIEIISTYDQINLFSKKMKNYRAAGVKVVWEIRYEVGEVYVYSGKNLKTIKLCTDKDICSAKPVISEFKMSVNDILKMPVMQ